MRLRHNGKPERALLTLVVASVTAIFIAGASQADDLATAKQLMKKSNASMGNIPNASFKGSSGKTYCGWVRQKLKVDQALVVIVARNPSFKDSGRGLSHDQTIASRNGDIVMAKEEIAKCRAAGL